MAWTVRLDMRQTSQDGKSTEFSVTIIDSVTTNEFEFARKVGGTNHLRRAKQLVQDEVDSLAGSVSELAVFPDVGTTWDITIDDTPTREELDEEEFKQANRQWIAALKAVDLEYMQETDPKYIAVRADALSKFHIKYWKQIYED